MNSRFDYEAFGLEPRDIILYETMLALPEAASIRTIAEAARMNRGTTFEIIKKLTQAGLIGSHYKNKRKYYQAQPPTRLLAYAEDKQNVMAVEMTKLTSYVEHLKTQQTQPADEQFTQFYDGEEEIAALLRDVLQTVAATKDKTYRVISSAEVRNHLYGKFRNFTRQRIKLGINVNVIGVGALGARAKLAEIKSLSSTDSPACYIIIYGDKVAQISLSEFGVVHGVLVQNSGVTALHSLMFDHLWSTLDA